MQMVYKKMHIVCMQILQTKKTKDSQPNMMLRKEVQQSYLRQVLAPLS